MVQERTAIPEGQRQRRPLAHMRRERPILPEARGRWCQNRGCPREAAPPWEIMGCRSPGTRAHLPGRVGWYGILDGQPCRDRPQSSVDPGLPRAPCLSPQGAAAGPRGTRPPALSPDCVCLVPADDALAALCGDGAGAEQPEYLL